MKFAIDQHLSGQPDDVARAYANPDLYLAFQDLPKMSRPEVVAHETSGNEVRLKIRYRFNGNLSSAARAVIDPARLTWVEDAVHDLASRSTAFRMIPDHYGDRFSCSGSYRFEADGTGTRRHCEAQIKVRAPLVGGAVENAIVSGLREHLAAEVAVLDAFLAG